MIIVMVICGVLLAISALLVTVRIVKGPRSSSGWERSM